MRVVVLSETYANPARRGKLQVLAGMGWTVEAAVPAQWIPSGQATPIPTSWEESGAVRIQPIPVQRRSDGARWDRRAIHRALTQRRPDLVQIEEEPWDPTAAAAAKVARRVGAPFVLLTQEGLPHQFGLLERRAMGHVLGDAAAVIAGNTLAAARVRQLRPELPCELIPPYGISAPAAVPEHLRGDEFTIGFVGRLLPERGLDLLCRACVRLLGRWRMVVVGTGPAQEELEQLVQRLGIAARVTWYGALPRPRLAEVWASIDCLAVPSRTTPRWLDLAWQPLVEAMAAGVPAVVTGSGVLPETVGDTGLVIPEDDVPALTEALQQLMEDPGLGTSLGAAARRRALDHYSDAYVAHRSDELWRQVLSSSVKTGASEGRS